MAHRRREGIVLVFRWQGRIPSDRQSLEGRVEGFFSLSGKSYVIDPLYKGSLNKVEKARLVLVHSPLNGVEELSTLFRGEQVWVRSKQGAFRLGKSGSLSSLHSIPMPDPDKSRFHQDGNRLWYSGPTGLYATDYVRNPILGLKGKTTHVRSHDEQLWVGTEQGLFYVHRDRAVQLNGVASEVTALVPNGKTLWVGTKAGLYGVIDGRAVPFPEVAGPVVNVRRHNGRIWVHAVRGVFYQDKERFTPLRNLGGVRSVL
jgi:ligand-binding sensor domain-containing protein